MTGTSMIPSVAEKENLQDLAQGMVESGYFKDTKSVAQAFVKVQAGRELGLDPVDAMRSFHIVEGKVELTADLLGRLVKGSEKYDYRVTTLTNEQCEIQFLENMGSVEPGHHAQMWDEIGVSSFTIEDARQAQLASKDVWKKYPRNMLFARALSNGVAFFCPDAVGGARVYVEGEISGDGVGNDDDAHGIDATPGDTPSPESTVEVEGIIADAETGEILDVEAVVDREAAQQGVRETGEKTGTTMATPVDDTGDAGDSDTGPIPVETDSSSVESEPPATPQQKKKLAILASTFGWDDEQRHAEAGVETFNDLTKSDAGALIEAWKARTEHDHVWAQSPENTKLAYCTVKGCLGAEFKTKLPEGTVLA